MGVILRADGLSKRFGGLKANDNVSISLDEGRILGLIGPNGAGKSTCFAMLAGSIPPTSGRIFVGEKEITGLPSFKVARAGVVRRRSPACDGRPASAIRKPRGVSGAFAISGHRRPRPSCRHPSRQSFQ